MQGGDLWKRQIVEAISTCLAFVIVLSPNSIQSNNVRKELDLADSNGRRVIPVMISKTDIPSVMQYQLAGLQIIDLSDSREKGLTLIIQSLNRDKTPETSLTFSPEKIPPSPQPISATGTI